MLIRFIKTLNFISQYFFRIAEDDNDEELCRLEKPLEEVQIEIPSKATLPELPVSSDDVTRLICPTTSTTQQLQEAKTQEVAKLDQQPQERPSSHYAHGQSLSHLLPPHSYAQISPRCYLFAGAEVTLENMDEDECNSDSSESDNESNDEFSDEEEIAEEPKVITVPDIDNVMPPALSCEVPVPEISPTPSTSSVSSPARSQLECGDRETAETIDANIHEDDGDLQPLMKKPRLDIEESIF